MKAGKPRNKLLISSQMYRRPWGPLEERKEKFKQRILTLTSWKKKKLNVRILSLKSSDFYLWHLKNVRILIFKPKLHIYILKKSDNSDLFSKYWEKSNNSKKKFFKSKFCDQSELWVWNQNSDTVCQKFDFWLILIWDKSEFWDYNQNSEIKFIILRLKSELLFSQLP